MKVDKRVKDLRDMKGSDEEMCFERAGKMEASPEESVTEMKDERSGSSPKRKEINRVE
jgi:hypothetical protein